MTVPSEIDPDTRQRLTLLQDSLTETLAAYVNTCRLTGFRPNEAMVQRGRAAIRGEAASHVPHRSEMPDNVRSLVEKMRANALIAALTKSGPIVLDTKLNDELSKWVVQMDFTEDKLPRFSLVRR